MKYMIPAVLLLTACAAYKTVDEVRTDEDAVTVPHNREPKVMAQCMRESLYTAEASQLSKSQPSPVESGSGVTLIGRDEHGYKHVVDIDASGARIAMNPAILFTGKAKAELIEIAEACATD